MRSRTVSLGIPQISEANDSRQGEGMEGVQFKSLGRNAAVPAVSGWTSTAGTAAFRLLPQHFELHPNGWRERGCSYHRLGVKCHAMFHDIDPRRVSLTLRKGSGCP